MKNKFLGGVEIFTLIVSNIIGLNLVQAQTASMMTITSPVFQEGGNIPVKYTCDGANASPAVEFSGVPEGTKSLVLIVDDPDAPAGTWTHWIVYDMSPDTTSIKENGLPTGAKEGLNSSNKYNYVGPCPPSGTHRYYFRLYALDNQLNLPPGSSRGAVEAAMNGHVLTQTQLMGKYSRK